MADYNVDRMFQVRMVKRFNEIKIKKMQDAFEKGQQLSAELMETIRLQAEKEVAEEIKKEVARYNDVESVMYSIAQKKWDEASELLVESLKAKRRFYTTKDDAKSEIWVYHDGIYIPNGRSEIKEILRNMLKGTYSTFLYNLVIAKIEPDTFIEAKKFFEQNNPEEVPVMNGILNIKTRELSEFNPDKIFFSKMPVVFNPDAKCPQIDKFLSEVLANEEDKKVFYEMVGCVLLKEYRFEKAFMLVGDGRNGKDKSLELIKRLVGAENCCSVPLSSLSFDSFIISEFFGRMVNLSGEIRSGDLKDTSAFKALTGRSLITAQRKFLNALSFVNFAKFIFACNELPMVYDNSKGFWERWVLLEYPFTFLSQEDIDRAEDKSKLKVKDENIIARITTPDELSGFLNACLDGFDRLIRHKGFSTTKGSAEIKDAWVRKSNSVMAFCLECLEEDYQGSVTKKELRKRYRDYCHKHHLTPKSEFVIKRTLEEFFGVSEELKNIFANVQERVWSGIRWKND